jgi:hypothetical protein
LSSTQHYFRPGSRHPVSALILRVYKDEWIKFNPTLTPSS